MICCCFLFAGRPLTGCLYHGGALVNRVTDSLLTRGTTHASSLLMILQSLSPGSSALKLWQILLVRRRLKSAMVFIREGNIFWDIIRGSQYTLGRSKGMPGQLYLILRVKNAGLLKLVLRLWILLDTRKSRVLFTWRDYVSLVLLHIDLELLFRIEVFEDLNRELVIFDSRAYGQNRVSVFVPHVAGECLLFNVHFIGTHRSCLLFLDYNRSFRLLNRSVFSCFRRHGAILSVISVAIHLHRRLWLLL